MWKKSRWQSSTKDSRARETVTAARPGMTAAADLRGATGRKTNHTPVSFLTVNTQVRSFLLTNAVQVQLLPFSWDREQQSSQAKHVLIEKRVHLISAQHFMPSVIYKHLGHHNTTQTVESKPFKIILSTESHRWKHNPSSTSCWRVRGQGLPRKCLSVRSLDGSRKNSMNT